MPLNIVTYRFRHCSNGPEFYSYQDFFTARRKTRCTDLKRIFVRGMTAALKAAINDEDVHQDRYYVVDKIVYCIHIYIFLMDSSNEKGLQYSLIMIFRFRQHSRQKVFLSQSDQPIWSTKVMYTTVFNSSPTIEIQLQSHPRTLTHRWGPHQDHCPNCDQKFWIPFSFVKVWACTQEEERLWLGQE